MTRLEWTEPDVADLENIQDYIARDSAECADTLIERPLCLSTSLNRFRKAADMCLNPRTQRYGNFLSRGTESSIGSGRRRCRFLQWCMAQEMLPG